MKLQSKIKQTAYSSVISALIAVLLLLGGVFDMLILSCASAAALIIHIVLTETGAKNALLVYAVSSLLANILMPMNACPIIFTAFFGFFPVLRHFVQSRIKQKQISYILLLLFYNADMVLIYTLFKGIFGLADQSPAYLAALLIVSLNLFYICFELLLGRIIILYRYRIKKMKGKKR